MIILGSSESTLWTSY